MKISEKVFAVLLKMMVKHNLKEKDTPPQKCLDRLKGKFMFPQLLIMEMHENPLI